MIARLRIAMALALVALVTPCVVLLQIIAMKTGWWSETVMPRLWHATVVKALGLRISVTGQMSDMRPLLIASNHVSWTDIMVIGSRFPVRFIAKSDLAGWPIMGYLSTLQRTVFVERERRRKSGEQASEIATLLAEGHAMILFPEGTTSDGNFIMPFKSSLFGAAQMAIDEAGVDRVFVQPLTIAYTRLHGVAMGRRHRTMSSWTGAQDLGPHLFRLLRDGAVDVELTFGEPVEFNARTKRKEIARDVEAVVRRAMGNMLAGAPATRI